MRVLIIDDERDVSIFPIAQTDSVSIIRRAHPGLAAMLDEEWDEVWLDHDMGPDSQDGTWLVNEIEMLVNVDPKFMAGIKKIIVHTANPVAGVRMFEVLNRLNFCKVMRIVL
jgi:hypothetical protein